MEMRRRTRRTKENNKIEEVVMVVDCEQSLFFFKFSEGSACARERRAAKLRDARNEDGGPTCRPKKRCKSNLSTVSVLANRSLHQDLINSGCRGTTVPNVCLQALILSLPCSHDFFTLSPNRPPA